MLKPNWGYLFFKISNQHSSYPNIFKVSFDAFLETLVFIDKLFVYLLNLSLHFTKGRHHAIEIYIV